MWKKQEVLVHWTKEQQNKEFKTLPWGEKGMAKGGQWVEASDQLF